MVEMIQYSSLDFATAAGLIAALVAVVGNTFKIPVKYRALLAIGFSLLFVFIPISLLNKIITAIVIGLTASGVYSQVKPSKNEAVNKENENISFINKTNQSENLANDKEKNK